MPAKAGIQNYEINLNSRFRWNCEVMVLEILAAITSA